MKTLKRIGAVGGAVVLVLCWPLAVGQIGQNLVTNGVDNLSNDQLHAELVSYDRGYLSSSAITRYTLLDSQMKQRLEQQGLPSEWTVKSDIQHHAFSLSAVSTLLDQASIPLQVKTQTRLNGNTDFQVNLDNWLYQFGGEQAFTLSVTPSNIQGTATVFGEISYSLRFPSIVMDFVNGEQVQLANISAEGKGKKEQGFWLGKQKIAVDSVMLNDERQANAFNLGQATYEFHSSMDAKKRRFTSQHVVTAERFKTDEGEIRDVTFDFTLGEVDREAFSQLSELYQRYPSLSHVALNQALPLVEKLFSQGFHLTLNQLALKMNQGELAAKWSLTIPEGTHNILQEPGVVFSALNGDGDIFVSQQFVKDYPFIQQGLDELVMMEMATHDDRGYQLKAEIKGGSLFFASGKQVPLMALMMPLMIQ
ncbi:DUF945 family protein [Vibrio cincinnatiensis]|uniref:DUF945 family protein n=1 Tax=Vibrio cincinnatiensis TaxID=675 RepID=UPI001EDEA209|nr:DUF945 family protein [Vibrio cincinnatiensis]MCG3731280.1 DUF945 family protein [Vibrio cincinnatiensis]MCG3738793.1 DUF945 family protein [Vibrio cincinnatiensis]MCG3742353.1 DUF945 family protein [Vibrio cincinnatiensis]